MRYLFREIEGFAYYEQKRKQISQKIGTLSNEELLNSDDSLKIILKAENSIETIVLGDVRTTENGEVDVNISRDSRFLPFWDGEGPRYRKGCQILVHIPFSNNEGLFDIKPSTFSTGGLPYADIENGEILFPVNFISGVDKAEDIKKKINGELDLLKSYVGWLNNDIVNYNNSLDPLIENGLKERRQKLATDQEILKQLGVELKQAPSIGFIKPVKKVELRVLQSREQTIDPALEMETYTGIIGFVNSLGINFERSHERLRELGEEPLRDGIWSALNAVYQGMVSAEAFNRQGKTDILIKYRDQTLYIAECKIWSSEDVFTKGITQLLSYLTWRDTKTSYIIFSRNRDIKPIIEKTNMLMETNPNCVTKVKQISDSCYLYKSLALITVTSVFLHCIFSI